MDVLLEYLSHCFYYSSVVAHCLPFFSRGLIILVVVTSDWWPYNSHTPAISLSGSNACSGYSKYVLPFSMSCNFLLKVGLYVVGKKSCGK